MKTELKTVYCKKDLFIKNMKRLIKGDSYTIVLEDSDYYWISMNGGGDSQILQHFSKWETISSLLRNLIEPPTMSNLPTSGLTFSRYFYTEKELRKLKLEKINSIE